MSQTQTDRRPPPRQSWRQIVEQMPAVQRRKFRDKLPEKHRDTPIDDWWLCGRREQLAPPKPWSIWIMLAGRGFGKTRAGAEHVIERHRSGAWRNSALIGATSRDVRRFMLEGESGVMARASATFRPLWKKGDMKLIWPNGSESHFYAASEPERLRGPNHDGAWCDEMASWYYLEETWMNLEMTLRKSKFPEVVITTTPKPRALFKTLLTDPDAVVSSGSTFENTENLSELFLRRIKDRYEGTRTGRQELYAEILDEADGALWRRQMIDDGRVSEAPALRQVVVAIDPAASRSGESSETGVVVCGLGDDLRGYLIGDLSGRHSPDQWARRAIFAYHQSNANVIVAEKNQGGDMVENTIQTTAAAMYSAGEVPLPSCPVKLVWASHAKFARAEPVAAMYEQNRVSHVGTFSILEDQLCTWEPTGNQPSPDRLDALVWGFTYLMLRGKVERIDTRTLLQESEPMVSAQPDWQLNDEGMI